MTDTPLRNIRVLDLSRVLAGPWCTQLLADLGAEVIKIEKPGEGDDTRAWGPPYFKTDSGGLSAYYISCNRGKKSITVDISTAEGKKIVQDLAAKSDVLIENYKVGGLKKYGLDYESVKKINSKIIYCSITGFGQDGPMAQKAGYDFMIQGMCGLMSVTGEPAGMPMKDGVALVDVMTGMYASSAILSALFARQNTDKGTHIDMALLDVGVAMMANQALNYLVSGKVPQRLGNAHPNIVPYQAFATKDGHVILAIGNDDQFARFAKACGKPEWIESPYFATNEARVRNRNDVVGSIGVLMHQKTTAEWIKILETENIPGGPINDLGQVFQEPQVKHRGTQLELKGVPQIRTPVRMSGVDIGAGTPPPHLGADTDQVLKDVLGYDAAQIASLKSKGAV
ncbi:MAG: CoA transferase [Alphaproteobacteria bacterium]|nr:MAG: CoA transferase [Alphaproteobacteria bacterium]